MQLPPGTTSHVTRRTYWPVPGRSLISWTEYYGNNQKRVSGAAGAVSVHSNHTQNDQTRPRECSHGNARARPSLALTHGTRASARFNLTPTFAAARSNKCGYAWCRNHDTSLAGIANLRGQSYLVATSAHTCAPPDSRRPRYRAGWAGESSAARGVAFNEQTPDTLLAEPFTTVSR